MPSDLSDEDREYVLDELREFVVDKLRTEFNDTIMDLVAILVEGSVAPRYVEGILADLAALEARVAALEARSTNGQADPKEDN
jgi:hypothetical protein